MADLTRLREILRNAPRPASSRELTYVADAGDYVAPSAADLAARIGATPLHDDGCGCFVIERRYPAASFHGNVRVGDLSHCDAANVSRFTSNWARGQEGVTEDLCAAEQPAGRVMFLDLETTGLTGGAGMCAFLVGCGWFDEGDFVIRQLFLSSFAGERRQLEAAAAWLNDCAAVVTFNGKTFDLPVMETRWLFHRMEPVTDTLHLDLLHPARCLWKDRGGPRPSRLASASWVREDDEGSRCTLQALERVMFGVSRVGDVPGFEIPSRYFQFVRSGDPAPLEPIFEHNRMDLLSLAALTARTLQLVNDGPAVARDVRECLALGRVYDRTGARARALACYLEAAGLDACTYGAGGRLGEQGSLWAGDVFDRRDRFSAADTPTKIEALRKVALHLRRERRHSEAVAIWQQILTLATESALVRREAAEALAIHHEHRARDISGARQFALEALDNERDPRRREPVLHRLARLDRKLTASKPTLPAM